MVFFLAKAPLIVAPKTILHSNRREHTFSFSPAPPWLFATAGPGPLSLRTISADVTDAFGFTKNPF